MFFLRVADRVLLGAGCDVPADSAVGCAVMEVVGGGSLDADWSSSLSLWSKASSLPSLNAPRVGSGASGAAAAEKDDMAAIFGGYSPCC